MPTPAQPPMHADIDWPDTTKKLRNHLRSIATVALDVFESITTHKHTSEGKEHTDSAMFNGSSGVLFAFFKYMKLLRKEGDNVQADSIEK